MITCTEKEHGTTINYLSKIGKIKPVEFEHNGEKLVANSAWAMCDYKKAHPSKTDIEALTREFDNKGR